MSYLYTIENVTITIQFTEIPKFLHNDLNIYKVDSVELIRLFHKITISTPTFENLKKFYIFYFGYYGWKINVFFESNSIVIEVKNYNYGTFYSFNDFKNSKPLKILKKWAPYIKDNSYFYFCGENRWNVIKIKFYNQKISFWRLGKKIWRRKKL